MARARQLVLIALAALAAASAPAEAKWSQPERLAPSTHYADPRAAFNARGDVAYAWATGGAVRLAIARPGKPFRVEDVPGSAAGREPRVDMDADGNVLVLWRYFDETIRREEVSHPDFTCCNGIRLIVRRAGGAYERRQTLTPKGHEIPEVAYDIAPRARVAVGWIEYGAGAFARLSGAGGRLGPVARLARHTERGGTASVMAIPVVGGRAYPLTVTQDPVRVRETTLETRGIAARRTVRSLDTASFSVETNGGGEQVLGWYREKPGRVVLARRRVGGDPRLRSFAAPKFIILPSLAIAPSGAAAAAWEQGPGRLVTTYRAPGRGFGDARLTDFARDAWIAPVRVGIDSAGRTVLAWQENVPFQPRQVVGAFRTRAGALRDVSVLASGIEPEYGSRNEVLPMARGRASVVFRRGRESVLVRGTAPAD